MGSPVGKRIKVNTKNSVYHGEEGNILNDADVYHYTVQLDNRPQTKVSLNKEEVDIL